MQWLHLQFHNTWVRRITATTFLYPDLAVLSSWWPSASKLVGGSISCVAFIVKTNRMYALPFPNSRSSSPRCSDDNYTGKSITSFAAYTKHNSLKRSNKSPAATSGKRLPTIGHSTHNFRAQLCTSGRSVPNSKHGWGIWKSNQEPCVRSCTAHPKRPWMSE